MLAFLSGACQRDSWTRACSVVFYLVVLAWGSLYVPWSGQSVYRTRHRAFGIGQNSSIEKMEEEEEEEEEEGGGHHTSVLSIIFARATSHQ